MSRNPLIPAKPTEITIDTLPQLFAHNRARFGGWEMTQSAPENEPPANNQGGANGGQGSDQAPERPSDIAEEEWNALGDPGKRAIARERSRAEAAERALAASRARPAPPKNKDDRQQEPPKSDPSAKPKEGEIDVEAIVQQAVTAAIKPFVEREEQRDARTAAEKVQTAVLDAAKDRLHDATDALTSIDLTTVVNEQGQADAEKVKAALDNLVQRKPHLAKPATERQAPRGIGGGGPVATTEGEKVKAALADMQKATGIRPPQATASN